MLTLRSIKSGGVICQSDTYNRDVLQSAVLTVNARARVAKGDRL